MLDLRTATDPDGPTRLLAVGELELASAPALMEATRRALQQRQPVELWLDGVTFVDSMGLEAIVRCRRMAHHRGAALGVVAGAGSPVATLLARTGLDRALPVREPRSRHAA